MAAIIKNPIELEEHYLRLLKEDHDLMRNFLECLNETDPHLGIGLILKKLIISNED